jgi:outer membrane protein TolC
MSYPMFGIGLQYMLINKRVEPESTMRMSAEESSMNGKDMLMPMVAITIPIFRNKYKAQQRETAFLKQSNREKYKAAVNMLEAELYSIQSELKNAAGKISLYRKQSELSQSACSLAISEFASGKGDLSNVIQVQRQLLDYNLKTSEAIATYNIMVARVQKLISTSELLIN